jgi:hypothetical protein
MSDMRLESRTYEQFVILSDQFKDCRRSCNRLIPSDAESATVLLSTMLNLFGYMRSMNDEEKHSVFLKTYLASKNYTCPIISSRTRRSLLVYSLGIFRSLGFGGHYKQGGSTST